MVFNYLDTLEPGCVFVSGEVVRAVRMRSLLSRRNPMDGTITRYMREYSHHVRPLKRVGPKGLSKYRVAHEEEAYLEEQAVGS
ncbi:MAG: hypothetical protein EOM12_11830 [Verrucomicrobiae bacterium]|nr:hypothetical protein [Verrucomicrobiae bacterium]